MKQCNIDVLEREALAVSDPDSPRYGQHLSSKEACEVTMCPGHTEGVQAVLTWVLGDPRERAYWLSPENEDGDEQDVTAEVSETDCCWLRCAQGLKYSLYEVENLPLFMHLKKKKSTTRKEDRLRYAHLSRYLLCAKPGTDKKPL